MLARLKAMPMLPKILLGCLVLTVAYGLTQGHRRGQSRFDEQARLEPASASRSGEDESVSDESDARREDPQAGQRQQALAQYQAQQGQLMTRVRACMAQMNAASAQMAAAAMNGQLAPQAPCAAYMPQWTAQEAFLETQIYRLQTGDTRSSLQQITGVQMGASRSSSYDNPHNDGGVSAVERYDRQAVRGTSMYSEEDGTQHELATAPYYFKDLSSGQMVSSTQPEPPNDGRDYVPLTAME